MIGKYEMEQLREQSELIRHFTNLWGYTREEVRKAINEIREDAGENPNDLQKMLLQRADNMDESLAHIEENIS